MMTGKLPSEHGFHAHNVDFTGMTRTDTLLADLPSYRAIGASSNIFAGTAFGFDGPFDRFSSVSRHALYHRGLDIDKFLNETDRESASRYLNFLQMIINHDYPIRSAANGAFLKITDILEPYPVQRLSDYGTKVVSQALLSQLYAESEPIFAFANYMEAHAPLQTTREYDSSLYDVPAGWSSNNEEIFSINTADDIARFGEYFENYRQLYAASINYLDRQLSRLIRDIMDMTNHQTTIIITADHGQNLGNRCDDHLIGHVSTLTDATLHVPLEVFNAPRVSNGTITDSISHLDLPELVVNLARGKLPHICRDIVPAERIGLGMSHDPENHQYWDRMIRCVYDGEMKYEWDSLGGRYHLMTDSDQPSWQRRISNDVEISVDTSELFNVDINTYKRNAQANEVGITSEMSGGIRDQLSDLGYL
jgi:hypothetical protein